MSKDDLNPSPEREYTTEAERVAYEQGRVDEWMSSARRRRDAVLAEREDELQKLIAAAQARYDAMTPEQKAEHDKAQRESWVRGMTGDDGTTTRLQPAAASEAPTRDQLLDELAACRDLATAASGHDDTDAISDPLQVATHVGLALGIPPEHRKIIKSHPEVGELIERLVMIRGECAVSYRETIEEAASALRSLLSERDALRKGLEDFAAPLPLGSGPIGALKIDYDGALAEFNKRQQRARSLIKEGG